MTMKPKENTMTQDRSFTVAEVKQQQEQASAIGHWRRLLMLYGNHYTGCASQGPAAEGQHPDSHPACNCGFAEAFT